MFRNVASCLRSTTVSHPSITPLFMPQVSPVDMSLYKLYHLRVLFAFAYEADLVENIEIASQQQVCYMSRDKCVRFVCQDSCMLHWIRNVHTFTTTNINAFFWKLLQLTKQGWCELRIEARARALSHLQNLQTGTGTHPISYAVGTGFTSGR